MTTSVAAGSVPLHFQIGARTLATIPRRLVRMALSLDDALAGALPVLPVLGREDQGFLVTSLPVKAAVAWDGIAYERQCYERHYVDLAAGEAAWRAGLSGQVRSALKRKTRKLAEASGGALDIRSYRTASEFAEFHPLARAVSATTYQEKLLGAGLPDDAAWLRGMTVRAEADGVRAWLAFVAGKPVAYLCCLAEGTTLRYDHVGHDPDWSALSPGTVLLGQALSSLFADRLARFDFTEGEGQHKRQFASASVACRDLLLLRPTIVNRMAVTALSTFDGMLRHAKRWTGSPLLAGLAKRVRRA